MKRAAYFTLLSLPIAVLDGIILRGELNMGAAVALVLVGVINVLGLWGTWHIAGLIAGEVGSDVL